MITVGLTGNVASGKSTVAEVWRGDGVPVVSADDLAREVVVPGSDGLAEVRRTFGDGVVAPDGSLDRAALRDRVFRDDGARRALEAILHPRIRALQEAWMRDREEEGARVAVAEIPLLFEVEREEDFDVTVFVDAPEALRIERMVRERGLDPAEARRIVDAQMDPSEKRRRADVVIENRGTLDELRAAARAVLDDLRARSPGGQAGARSETEPAADPLAAGEAEDRQ